MNNDPVSLMFILFGLSLMPVIFVLTTSFIKIAMVCILTRESLGVQQVPPNIVIYGLSIILSFYIMGPVYNNTYTLLKTNLLNGTQITAPMLIEGFETSAKPVKDFLLKHSNRAERDFFYKSLKRYWTPEMLSTTQKDDFIILVPAFVVSEITQGFKIGFLLYLPSLIIDIVISNILMAMGMMMMSPVTISLPIKLLLFISVDGWSRLINLLMSTY